MRVVSRLNDLTFLQQTSFQRSSAPDIALEIYSRAPAITQSIQSRQSVLIELDAPMKETYDGHPKEYVQ